MRYTRIAPEDFVRFLFPALLFCSVAHAEVACTRKVAPVAVFRAESLSEIVPDSVFQCLGRLPGAINVEVQFNTNVANVNIRGVSQDHGISSDAVILMDVSQIEEVQIGRNTFSGEYSGLNGMRFENLPASGLDEDVILRITNLRVNPNALPEGAEVKSRVTISDAATGETIFSEAELRDLGVARIGLRAEVLNQTSIPSGNSHIGAIGSLRFTEGFANAFRPRTNATNRNNPLAPPAPQTLFSGQIGTETGFFTLQLTHSLADHGTRLVAQFFDLPANTQVYVPGINMGDDPGSYARAITSVDGPAVLQPLQSNNYFLLNGDKAVWEIFSSNPNAIEQFTFPIDMIRTGMPIPVTTGVSAAMSFGGNPTLEELLQSLPTPRQYPRMIPVRDGATNRNTYNNGVLGAEVAYMFSELLDTDVNDRSLHATRSLCPFLDEQLAGRCMVNINGPSTRGVGLNLSIDAGGTPNAPVPPPQDAIGPRSATTAWLTATLNATTTPATALVTANTDGLSPGVYNGTVRVTSTTPNVNPVNVPVTLMVRGPNAPKVTGFGVGNAGSYRNNIVAPGEAIVVFGSNLGPAQLAGLKLTNNVVDTLLGGTRVLFDGIASPMIYSLAGQVSCFVPFSVAGKKFVTMEVEYQGVRSHPVTMAVAPAAPGLLTANQSGGGLGAILNQDLTYNSQTGALPDTFVYLFGVGAGGTNPPALDGRINAGNSTLSVQPIKVFLDGIELPAANVQYAGPAPGLVEGVFQVNIKLPANVRRNARVPVRIQFGDYATQLGVMVNVR